MLTLVGRSRYRLCFEVTLDVAVDTSHSFCVEYAQSLVIADVGVGIGSAKGPLLAYALRVFKQMVVPLKGNFATGLQCSAIETSLRSLIQ